MKLDEQNGQRFMDDATTGSRGETSSFGPANSIAALL
jgi:hypothetical protein